jgi:hypothetical protein
VQEAAPRLPTGSEPVAAIEVEYPATADLQPVGEVGAEMEGTLKGMADSDWTVATPAMVILRRIVVHHKEEAWARMSVPPTSQLCHPPPLLSLTTAAITKHRCYHPFTLIQKFQDP